MGVGTSKPKEVWYVDSSASNHMTNYEERFSNLEKLEQPGVVETGQVCEAYQLGKQHWLPFANEHNRSHNKPDMIHLDVRGLTQNG